MKGGKHFIIDINNVKNDEAYAVDKLYELCEMLCKFFNFNVLHRYHHEFTPQGVTLFYLLAESHISIHTFPEEKYISMDIYTCNFSEQISRDVLKCVIECWFRADVRMRGLTRG